MPLAQPDTSLPEKVDVAVVGAGLSGLACAQALCKHDQSVAIFEARDRVGGRTLSQQMGGATFDLGGQWLGARQPRLKRLTAELGLRTFATHHEGKKVLDIGGSLSTYSGSIPNLAPWRLLELHNTLRKLDKMTSEVPLDDPSKAPEARDWDSISLEGWKREQVRSHAVRALIDASVRVVFGAEPRELSLLHFLFYLRSGGGLMSLIEIEGGAQQTRFEQGAQALSQGLAERIAAQVFLSSPVQAITQDSDGAWVHVGERRVRASHVVVAVPPALAGRIAFSPSLPASRDMLTQRFPMGATVKCLALYDRPFWRERGLSGEAVCGEGPVTVVFDNSSSDGKVGSLLAFVVGDAARTWHERDVTERRRLVLSTFARYFGDRAFKAQHYIEQDWSTETWSRGCPVGVLGPGALSVAGTALRKPVGRVHWAGTETAYEWNGYMEGALEAGERAASEILRKTR